MVQPDYLDTIRSQVIANTPLLLDPVLATVCSSLRRSFQNQVAARLRQLSSEGREGIDWLQMEIDRALLIHLLDNIGGPLRHTAHSKACVARASALLSEMPPSAAAGFLSDMHVHQQLCSRGIRPPLDMQKDFLGRVIANIHLRDFSRILTHMDPRSLSVLFLGQHEFIFKIGRVLWRVDDGDLARMLPVWMQEEMLCGTHVACWPMNRLRNICEHIKEQRSIQVGNDVLAALESDRATLYFADDLDSDTEYDADEPLSDDDDCLFGVLDKPHCYVSKDIMTNIQAGMAEGVLPTEEELMKLLDIGCLSKREIFSRIYVAPLCEHIIRTAVNKLYSDRPGLETWIICWKHPYLVVKSLVSNLGVAKVVSMLLKSAESIREDAASEGRSNRELDNTKRTNPSLQKLVKMTKAVV